MKKSVLPILTFGIFFLFLLQTAGSLVESIYILELLKTSMDEKALGVLFFFSPVLLLLLRRRPPRAILLLITGILIVGRGLTPYLDTVGRLFASGLGVSAAFLLFPLLLTAHPPDERPSARGLGLSLGLALAAMASIFLRTVNYSLDYSLQREGGWVGWGLGLALGFLVSRLDWPSAEPARPASKGPALSTLGVFTVIGLMYLAFAAPAVMARWTEGDYRLIVIAVSLLSAAWAVLALHKPEWLRRISGHGLLAWNALFALSLTGTLLAHRVSFPPGPNSPPVVVSAPTWLQHVPLGLMLLLCPVIFLDAWVLFERILQIRPSPRMMAPGMLFASFVLLLLIFMQIFSNVWGYVEPVSLWFRNKFWLPYLLLSGLLTLLVGSGSISGVREEAEKSSGLTVGWAIGLGALVLGTAVAAFLTTRVRSFEARGRFLVVMTYNVQQANNVSGERSYREQLAWMERVSPDIIALQESDSARVSFNNGDIVRYYAGKLGYYSYYGPTTVTGTFGTAVLSKYPLRNTHSVFTFSDQDEIGTAVAEVEVSGRLFTIYNVHPDGSDTAMLTFARTLLDLIQGKDNVIALGDYNLRDDEQPYRMIAARLTNAWESVYPTKISADGVDMSGENRIDHIFFSPSLRARNPVYVLPPQSATDHPLHWTEIHWEE